jgi:hypothetical protein
MTDKQPEEMQVPLYELLEDIPEDFRIGFKDNDNWSAGVTWHPIGVTCHKAAAELRRLHEAHDWQYKMAGDRLRRIEQLEKVNAELLEAIKAALSDDQPYIERCKAALVKATGENNG